MNVYEQKVNVFLEQNKLLKEIPPKFKKVISRIKFGNTIVRYESGFIPLDEPVTKEQGIAMVKKFLSEVPIEVELTTALLVTNGEEIQMQEIVPTKFD